jgi:hypothetical protein
MAEPAPKRDEANPTAATTQITITYGANGYGPIPVSSTVANNGTVTFICNQACWVWTQVGGVNVDAFTGETGNHLVCPAGSTAAVPSVQNTTITIVPLAPNSQPPGPSITASIRGTIAVGSVHTPHKEEKE